MHIVPEVLVLRYQLDSVDRQCYVFGLLVLRIQTIPARGRTECIVAKVKSEREVGLITYLAKK